MLSTGTYVGYTSKEKASANLCYGEVVAIPWGGVANIKYYRGYFVTADNRIATSNNRSILSNRYLHWWMESNIGKIQNTYRGASIQHPSMNDVLTLSIQYPCIVEQSRIADRLDSIDNLITLHQRKFSVIPLNQFTSSLVVLYSNNGLSQYPSPSKPLMKEVNMKGNDIKISLIFLTY